MGPKRRTRLVWPPGDDYAGRDSLPPLPTVRSPSPPRPKAYDDQTSFDEEDEPFEDDPDFEDEGDFDVDLDDEEYDLEEHDWEEISDDDSDLDDEE